MQEVEVFFGGLVPGCKQIACRLVPVHPDTLFIASPCAWSLGYKAFFLFDSAERGAFPAHRCWDANHCWHFNIYEREKLHPRLT